MKYIAVIEKEKDSDYGVFFPDVPGVITAGSTIEEAIDMAHEALELHLETMIEDGDELPEASYIQDIINEYANAGDGSEPAILQLIDVSPEQNTLGN